MYGDLRIIADNKITSVSMLTLSSQATGRVSGVKKSGDGVATMLVYGSFQGAFDLSYTIQCDGIASGASVGQATIRWKTSDTASGWEGSGVLTATTPYIALSADGLGTGISISFVGATGADFVVGDTWTFECRASYGGERLLDRNRNTYWKSTGITAETIVIDYGAATQITAAVLHDHNFTSSATVKFEANDTNVWTSPAYSTTFATITNPLVAYADKTYRYNRWSISDATNTDGYLKVGNIITSVYDSLDKVNGEWGSQQINGLQLQSNESEAGILRRYFYATRQNLTLVFGSTLSNDDVDAIISIQETLIDQSLRRILPVWVHLFSDVTDTLKLYEWRNIGEWNREFRSYLLNSGVTLDFAEVVKV